MTLKLKSTTNELWKGWNLAWYHHFTHTACEKNREGYGKNWMHFVYKLDNLFRSIRVSDENSSVTKGIHFLNYYNYRLFGCLVCTIQSHVINFQPFLPSFSIFHAFTDLFWAKWTWNWKALQMNFEKVESWHGIIISPT